MRMQSFPNTWPLPLLRAFQARSNKPLQQWLLLAITTLSNWTKCCKNTAKSKLKSTSICLGMTPVKRKKKNSLKKNKTKQENQAVILQYFSNHKM